MSGSPSSFSTSKATDKSGADAIYGHCMLDNNVNKGCSIETQRLYYARRTLLEMLTDRGYNVPAVELTRSLSEFTAAVGDNPDLNGLRMSFAHMANASQKIMVIFLGPEEIKLGSIRTLSTQIPDEESLHSLILITQSKMNAFARKELDKFPCKVEIFQIGDLYVNITKHMTMPKHEILNAEEKKSLLEKYKLKSKQLPMMLQSDAIARYYGLEKGDVVKITYDNDEVGYLQTYRSVM